MSGPTTPTKGALDLTGASWLLAEDEDFSFLESPAKTPAGKTGSGWLSDDDDMAFDSPKPTPQKTERIVSRVRRRIEDDFSDDEEVKTPQKKPLLTPPETPLKLRSIKRKLADLDPSEDFLSPKDKLEIQEGLDSLREVADSPQKKKRSAEARNIHSLFVEKATKGATGVMEKHGQLVDSLGMTPFFGMLLGKLNEIDAACAFPALEFPKPVLPVNYKHIVEPVVYTTAETQETKSLGWHFCTAEYFPMLRDQIHSISGVFSATYRVDGAMRDKRSSFFPLSITSVQMLDDYIQSGELYAENENRALYRIPAMNIYFEAIKKNGCLHSAYPLLFVGTWEEKEDFPIFVGREAYTSGQILDAAKKTMKDYAHRGPVSTQPNPIRYYSANGSQVYIEIAPALVGEFGILQGVLFVFDRNLFSEFEDQFDQMFIDK